MSETTEEVQTVQNLDAARVINATVNDDLSPTETDEVANRTPTDGVSTNDPTAEEDTGTDNPDDEESEEAENEPALVRARRDASKYRTRLRAAEATATTYRNQLIEHYLGTDGVTIKALESAGINLDDLVGEDGRIDREAVNDAAEVARTELGIPNNRFNGSADQGRVQKQPANTRPTWGNLLSQ